MPPLFNPSVAPINPLPAPGTAGNVLTSNGNAWISAPLPEGSGSSGGGTTSGGDPNFNNVVLLMHMDGTNNSTTFTDVKGKSIARTGDAVISTAQSKFGSASAYFDGNGDYLSSSISSDFQFFNNDFTIELFIYLLQTRNNTLITTRETGIGQAITMFVSGNKLGGFAGNTTYGSIGTDISLNAWNHLALVRAGNQLLGFINGIQQWSAGFAHNLSEGRLLIGSDAATGGSNHTCGYMDEIRITKGLARYTATFTVPTTAFPNS